jgi:hypothetical protein
MGSKAIRQCNGGSKYQNVIGTENLPASAGNFFKPEIMGKCIINATHRCSVAQS